MEEIGTAKRQTYTNCPRCGKLAVRTKDGVRGMASLGVGAAKKLKHQAATWRRIACQCLEVACGS